MPQLLASGKVGSNKYDNRATNPNKVLPRLDMRQIAQSFQRLYEVVKGFSLSGNEGFTDALDDDMSIITASNINSYKDDFSQAVQTLVSAACILEVDSASTANALILNAKKISADLAPDGNDYSIEAPLPFNWQDDLSFRFRAIASNTDVVSISIPDLEGLSGSIDLLDEFQNPLAPDAIILGKYYTVITKTISTEKKAILIENQNSKRIGTANSFISNLGLSTSVSSNALTIALKDSAGSNPSAGSPVRLGFRNSSLSNGTYTMRSIAASLSTVISSGSTLGFASGAAHDLYVYLIDAAGTIELAYSMTAFDDNTIQSTIAEGGAGAADSNHILYSTTARTNVPIRLIGKINIAEATAGTWASNATSITIAPFNISPIHASYNASAGMAIATGATPTVVNYANKEFDTHNIVTIGSSWNITIPKTAKYLISVNTRYANGLNWSLGSFISNFLFINGANVKSHDKAIEVASVALPQGLSIRSDFNYPFAAGDIVDIRCAHGESTDRGLVAAGSLVYISITELK